jgi:hypothetical protein
MKEQRVSRRKGKKTEMTMRDWRRKGEDSRENVKRRSRKRKTSRKIK